MFAPQNYSMNNQKCKTLGQFCESLYIPLAQMVRTTQPTRDPYAMDIDKINLSPRDRVEHIWNNKCFICHREGCHSSKHRGYPQGRGKPPQQGAWPSWRATKTREVEGDPWINNFMKQHRISAEQTLDLLGNYYSKPVTSWEGMTKEELVNEITQGFRKGWMDQHHHFPQTFGLYL